MIEWVVSSCVLILLIIAIRQFFRKRLDLKVRYALWLIVAVRLLVPVSFAESRFSILNLLDTDRFFGTERAEAGRDTGAVRSTVAGSAILWGENKGDPEALFGVKGDVSAAVFGESGDNPEIFHGEDGNAQGAVYGEKGSDKRAFLGENGGVLAEFPGNYDDILTGDGESGGRTTDSGELSQGKRLRGELFQREQLQGQVKGKKFLERKSSGEQFGKQQFLSETGKMVSMGSAAGRFLSIIWLIGSLLCGTVIFIANLRDSRKRLRSRMPFIREGESRLPVYVSETVQTPCVAGIFQPAIYLTEEALEDESQIPYIIAHENMHYRHKDHLWAVVRTVCLCVHWFNPLVWIAARLARQDGELACDADVLKYLGREERVEYGKALLELSIRKSTVPVTVNLATTMSGGKRQLWERLEMIRKRPGTTAGVLAVAAVLVTAALAVTFTGRRESDEFTGSFGEDNRIPANADQADGTELTDGSLRDEYDGDAGTGIPGSESTESGTTGQGGAASGTSDSGGDGQAEAEVVRPTKEEVLAMREQVLEGMSAEEIKRLKENIKVANQRMESAYLYDAIFEKLEDKENLYWNYFDEKGEIQVGWAFDGSYREMREIMEKESLTKEEFDVRYGTPVMVYNRFDAGNFMELMEEMKELVQNEKLKDDLQQLIDETSLAAETHEMEHASNIYKILHDMDYYLLRYGLEDVGRYVQDASTIAKYYGVLSVYD